MTLDWFANWIARYGHWGMIVSGIMPISINTSECIRLKCWSEMSVNPYHDLKHYRGKQSIASTGILVNQILVYPCLEALSWKAKYCKYWHNTQSDIGESMSWYKYYRGKQSVASTDNGHSDVTLTSIMTEALSWKATCAQCYYIACEHLHIIIMGYSYIIDNSISG